MAHIRDLHKDINFSCMVALSSVLDWNYFQEQRKKGHECETPSQVTHMDCDVEVSNQAILFAEANDECDGYQQHVPDDRLESAYESTHQVGKSHLWKEVQTMI